MAEKRENSVLFSLRELRRIEDDRIKQEEDDVRSREEAEVQARADGERRAREEGERARREAEAVERRRADDAERQVREDALRLEEAERKARVEAQMHLEKERMKLEVEAKVAMGGHKKSTGLLVIVGLLVLCVGGVGAFAWKKKLREDELQRKNAVVLAQYETLQRKMRDNDARTAAALAAFQAAKTEEEKKKAEDELAAARREAQELKDRAAANASSQAPATSHPARAAGAKTKPDKPREDGKIKVKCSDPNDPLCGI